MTLQIISTYANRAAHALLACTAQPRQPTLITEQQDTARLYKLAAFALATGDCLDAVEPAQGSHERFHKTAFAYVNRE